VLFFAINLSTQKRFTAACDLVKPNDIRCMNLMNESAKAVMKKYPDICICIGMSDEYSFVIHPDSNLYNRRERFEQQSNDYVYVEILFFNHSIISRVCCFV